MGLNAGAWSETAFVSVSYYGNGSQSSNDVSFTALTETIDIDMGDKDTDQIVNLKGGRMIKKIPQDITTLTFEAYPVDIDSKGGGTATGISQMFHDLQANWGASEPLQQLATRNRELYRVAILWSDDPASTLGTSAVTSGYNGYRLVFAHCYCTSMKPSFTDGVLKVTFSFKVVAFNPQGVANICEQSTDSTAQLGALNTYNSTNYNPTGSSAYTW